MSKYYNIRTTTSDGITFDSQKEAYRWIDLRMLQRAGKISDLHRQVKFELIPAQYETVERYSKTGRRLKDGKKLIEKGVDYIADFVYTENGKQVVEDVKGMRTDVYKLKKKMMLYFKGIRIREI